MEDKVEFNVPSLLHTFYHGKNLTKQTLWISWKKYYILKEVNKALKKSQHFLCWEALVNTVKTVFSHQIYLGFVGSNEDCQAIWCHDRDHNFWHNADIYFSQSVRIVLPCSNNDREWAPLCGIIKSQAGRPGKTRGSHLKGICGEMTSMIHPKGNNSSCTLSWCLANRNHSRC